jgi:orotidine-5'-phosphate decarboxylase
MTIEPRARLVYPLDYATLAEARAGAEQVREAVGVLKVGLELFVREGPAAVKLGAELGCDIFLDLKLCDIPETVERAVASAGALGVRYLTVHAFGGPEMLARAARRAESCKITLLAVTVLTSLDAEDLRRIGVQAPPEAETLTLARLARSSGVPGLVCSSAEVERLRSELGPNLVLVTPGIRPAGSDAGDQKRIGTPAEAIGRGADLLVVGRPIRDAADPLAAARAIVDEIAAASGLQAHSTRP